jgi:trans-aconitate methyltransferase
MDKKHWEDIYQKKSESEVSWFQEKPIKSLELIDELKLKLTDKIIDVGGGDSHLVDHLLDKGFQNITVLDISEAALERAKKRLAGKAQLVRFIVSDVTKFNPSEKYHLWHDRATFHFLTQIEEVNSYLKIASDAILAGGFLIVSTFSKSGPDKCSGLTISKYSEAELKATFEEHFENLKCFEDTHKTPWGTTQDFIYCGFRKK